MLRRIYVFFIRLHPGRFRRRFGDEMLWIFDQPAGRTGRMWLLADAAVSLFRQRLLRPDFEGSGGISTAADGVPSFFAVDTSLPRQQVFFRGGVLALLAWFALSLAMQEAPRRRAVWPQFAGVRNFAGSSRYAQSVRPSKIQWSAAPGFLPVVLPVFGWESGECAGRKSRIFAVLDTDNDGELSAREISEAPNRLALLDSNRDGRLSCAELMDP